MNYAVLKVMAAVLIVLATVKLVVVIYSPECWLRFVRRVYARPQVTSTVALVGAALVLYLLIGSGVTIVEILAVSLFVALLMVVGVARYGTELSGWLAEQNLKVMVKDLRLYILIWFALLVWGSIAIFML